MAKTMIMNGFTQCCVNHHSEGQWKNPLDGTATGYRDIGYWVELAKTLEAGGFDCLFLADAHGTYNVYKGSREAAVRHGVQFPSHDPTVIIPAMAYATKHLGFACTYSTTYFAPYQTAKLFSTLDHLTGGRIAWNIVTSYLPDALANFGIKDELTHDQRYDRAEEYMEVVYKLWEHSWEEDAVRRDRATDVFSDPAKVHEINHVGTFFDVPGPHMCEPSPQRTPMLFQAGQSGRGIEFAAKHAEAVFCVYPTIASSARNVAKFRAAAIRHGRDPANLKICQGISVTVAATEAQAQEKYETARSFTSPDGALALFSGWSGIDLSTLTPDKPLHTYESNAIQGVLGMFRDIDPDRVWTVQDIADSMAVASIIPKVVGSPTTVADALERWMDETGIDGFHLVPATQPVGFQEFVDLVVPELRRRGRMRQAPEGATLREHYFGAGNRRLAAEHVAHRSLPAWRLAP